MPAQQRRWWARAACAFGWLDPPIIVVLHRTGALAPQMYDAAGRRWGIGHFWRVWGVRRWYADAVPEELLLRRTWWQPDVDAQTLRAAVALRMRVESPFAPDDSICLWTDEPCDGGRRVHALWVSRRLLVQHLPEHFQHNSGRLLWAELPLGSDHWVALPTPGLESLHRWRNMRRLANGVAVAVALTLTAAVAITPSWQLRQRAIDAQSQWAQLQQQAEPALGSRQRLTAAIEQIAAFEQSSAKLRDPVVLLDWLTAQLPDDTYVTDLEYEADVLRLQGLTSNAAALMRRLGEQPGVAAVTASRPATKVIGLGRESYAIEIRLAAVANMAGVPVSSPERGKAAQP